MMEAYGQDDYLDRYYGSKLSVVPGAMNDEIEDRLLKKLLNGGDNITLINLNNENMSNVDISALLRAVKGCHSVNSVSMNNVGIDAKGLAALTALLEICPNIQNISLNGNLVGSEGAVALAEALTAHPHSLLSLSLAECGIGNMGIMALCEMLQRNATVVYMNVVCNQFTAPDTLRAARLENRLFYDVPSDVNVNYRTPLYCACMEGNMVDAAWLLDQVLEKPTEENGSYCAVAAAMLNDVDKTLHCLRLWPERADEVLLERYGKPMATVKTRLLRSRVLTEKKQGADVKGNSLTHGVEAIEAAVAVATAIKNSGEATRIVHVHICGPRCAGKTTTKQALLRALNYTPLDTDVLPSLLPDIAVTESRTLGIVAEIVECKDSNGALIRVLLNDYGGQEEFLANHAPHLSAANSVYVILVPLWDKRPGHDRAYELDAIVAMYTQWLTLIHAVGTSDHPHCMTVLNFATQFSAAPLKLTLQMIVDEIASIQETFHVGTLYAETTAIVDANNFLDVQRQLVSKLMHIACDASASVIASTPALDAVLSDMQIEGRWPLFCYESDLRRLIRRAINCKDTGGVMDRKLFRKVHDTICEITQNMLESRRDIVVFPVPGDQYISINRPNWLTSELFDPKRRREAQMALPLKAVQHDAELSHLMSAQDINSAVANTLDAQTKGMIDDQFIPKLLQHVGVCIPVAKRRKTEVSAPVLVRGKSVLSTADSTKSETTVEYWFPSLDMPSMQETDGVVLDGADHIVARQFKLVDSHFAALPPGYFHSVVAHILSLYDKMGARMFKDGIELKISAPRWSAVQVVVRQSEDLASFVVMVATLGCASGSDLAFQTMQTLQNELLVFSAHHWRGAMHLQVCGLDPTVPTLSGSSPLEVVMRCLQDEVLRGNKLMFYFGLEIDSEGAWNPHSIQCELDKLHEVIHAMHAEVTGATCWSKEVRSWILSEDAVEDLQNFSGKDERSTCTNTLPVPQIKDVEVRRIKVTLVGPAGAGKAALSHRLQTSTSSGHQFQLWDCGDQEVYCNTHSMFLYTHGTHVIMWNAESHTSGAMPSPLHASIIDVLNRTPNAPIILVSTDGQEGMPLSSADVTALQVQYPSIAACFHFDTSTDQGLDELKAKLIHISRAQSDTVQVVPSTFLNAEQCIFNLRKEGKFSVSFPEFLKLAQSVDVEETQIDELLHLLQQWGVVQVLPGGDVVLDPQELHNIVSSVIATDSVAPCCCSNGILQHRDCNQLWPTYHSRLCTQFLEFLYSCELAYPLSACTGVSLCQSLVPALLPDSSHCPAEMAQQCFPEYTTDSARYVNVEMTFSAWTPMFFPALQARLQAMTTHGGAWKQYCFLSLEDGVSDDMSHALLYANPTDRKLEIRYPLDHDEACSAAVRTVRHLLDDRFKMVQIIELQLTAGTVALDKAALMAELSSDRNAECRGKDGDGIPCIVRLNLLRELLPRIKGNLALAAPETAVEVSSPVIRSTVSPTTTVETSAMDELTSCESQSVTPPPPPIAPDLQCALAKCNEECWSEEDLVDLSLMLLRHISAVSKRCNVHEEFVSVIWLLMLDKTTDLSYLVPVSPGKSAAHPWSAVHNARIECWQAHSTLVRPPPGNPVFDSTVLESLFTLGLSQDLSHRQCEWKGLIDLAPYEAAIRRLQGQYFTVTTNAEGIQVCMENSTARNYTVSVQSLHAPLSHSASKVDYKQQFLVDGAFQVHKLPLLLSISQPHRQGVRGHFAEAHPDLYRLHFICPLCGVKAPSGKDGRGYKLRMTEERAVAATKYQSYALQALQLISQLTPMPLPYLNHLADYLPCEELIVKCGLKHALSAAQEHVTASENAKKFRKHNRKGVNVKFEVPTKTVGEIEFQLEDVQMVLDLLEAVGDPGRPRLSGLKQVYSGSLGAWVCNCTDDDSVAADIISTSGIDTIADRTGSGRTSPAGHKVGNLLPVHTRHNCRKHFLQHSNACLKLTVTPDLTANACDDLY